MNTRLQSAKARARACSTALPLGFLLLAAASHAAQDESARRVADEDVQLALSAFVSSDDEVGRRDATAELRRLAGPRHGRLLPELLHFTHDARSTREGMAFGVVVEALRIPEAHVIEALVPLFEDEDPGVRTSVAGVLAEYEHADPDRRPSFAAYRPFLEGPARRGEAPPAGLVRHLYETDPGVALLALARVNERDPARLRELLWAEHVIADTLWKQRYGFLERDAVEPEAAAELAFLARHEAWWARLAAAEVMAQHTAFRDAELLAALAEDKHALVRAAAAR